MKCGVCYDVFFTPKTKEETEKLFDTHIKDNSNLCTIIKFKNRIITPKHDTTISCQTPNCKCLICSDCWFTLVHENDDKNPSNFKCPYCRQINWKYYMNFVFHELQLKVLGKNTVKDMAINSFKKNFGM